jgi:hypothetical protein
MATQTEQPQVVEESGYDQDVYLWSLRTAELIRAGRFEELDRENVAEEIESLGKRYLTELRSRTRTLLAHMLKRDYQPEKRSKSWIDTIDEQRDSIESVIVDSPSLMRMLPDLIRDEYDRAVRSARRETGMPRAAFPATCPYSAVQVYGEWIEE